MSWRMGLLLTLVLAAPVGAQEPKGQPSAAAKAELRQLEAETRQFRSNRKFAEALSTAQKALDIERQALAKDDPRLASRLKTIAECAEGAADWPAAEAAWDERLRMLTVQYGADDYRTIETAQAGRDVARRREFTPDEQTALEKADAARTEAGQLLMRRVLDKRGIPRAQEAISAYEKLWGADHPNTATARLMLGIGYFRSDKPDLAEPPLRAAMTVFDKYSPASPQAAQGLEALAQLHRNRREFEQARTIYLRVITIWQKVHGPASNPLAGALNELGETYRELDKDAEAATAFQHSIQTYDRVNGKMAIPVSIPLENLGSLYLKQEKPAEAVPLLERAVAIREPLQPPASDRVASFDLVKAYSSAGRLADALALARRKLPALEKRYGDDSREVASMLVALGDVLNSQGKYSEAETPYRRALAIREKKLGPDSVYTGLVVRDLASALLGNQKVDEARPLAERALRLLEKEFGPTSAHLVPVMLQLAAIEQVHHKFEAAEVYARRGMTIAEKAFGPDAAATAGVQHVLAALCLESYKLDEAEALLLRSLAVLERHEGKNSPASADGLITLARVKQRQGDGAAAEGYLLRALEIAKQHPETTQRQRATSLKELGRQRLARGDFATAEANLLEGLKLIEQAVGPNHLDTSEHLTGLGELYLQQENLPAVERYYGQALAIRERVLGAEHVLTAQSLNNVAVVYIDQFRWDEARRLLTRAHETYAKEVGADHAQTAQVLGNLAWLTMLEMKGAEAEALFRQVLEIDRRVLGDDHPTTLLDRHRMSTCLAMQSRFAEAATVAREVLAVQEKTLGMEHPQTSITAGSQAAFEICAGNTQAARPLAERHLAGELTRLENAAAVQTEQQQFLMLPTPRASLNVVLEATVNDTAANVAAWQHILTWKGLTTARQTALRRALAGDPAYADFRRVSQELSTLSLNPPRPPADPQARATWEKQASQLRKHWEGERARLTEQHQSLEKQLAAKSAAMRKEQDRRGVTAEAIQTALGQTRQPTALVDLILYMRMAGTTKGVGHIVAFVARGDRPVERVELGPVAPVMLEIGRWRESFGRRGEHDPGAELRRMLWQPLLPALAGIETVLISPDAELAMLPWGGLPGDKPDSYLIEERAIAVIPVPQLLPEMLREPARAGAPQSLLLAGDIDYGGEPGAAVEHSLVAAARGQSDDVTLHFAELPAAHDELAAVRSWYERAGQQGQVDVLDLRRGTEAAFREQAPRHAWLHVITHGFFAPNQLTTLFSQPGEALLPAAVGTRAAAKQAGIGAALAQQDNHCYVTKILPGGPAKQDGRLQVGDELVALSEGSNGPWLSTQGTKRTIDIVDAIRGPLGTTIRLQVRPQGKQDLVEISYVRAILPEQSKEPLHPGLLSGLAFAGANLPPAPGQDDGILTAMEVAALDLSGVDTVVLSACETGLGKVGGGQAELGQVAGGEGLLGLQRSFQVAGCKSVVASLWKVPDAATGRLMQRFYENLWNRKLSKLEALREAQIFMLREAQTATLKETGNRGLDIDDQPPIGAGALPPYYWAAFVLSGDWR